MTPPLPRPWLLLPLTLLAGVAAARPAPPVRERQERRVLLAEPPAELRVAGGVLTRLVFDAPIDGDSVELEGRTGRFRRVDVDERSLSVEPLVDLAPGERLGLRLRLREGVSGERVALALVSHPSRVDERVELLRPHLVEELRAALALKDAELQALRARFEAHEPTDFILAGRVKQQGVRSIALLVQWPQGSGSGLLVKRATAYQAEHWMVVAMRVLNPPGEEPWAPASARLVRAEGPPLEVRRIRMDREWLQPGEHGLIAVETPPFDLTEVPFVLELADAQGRRPLLLDTSEVSESTP